MSTKKLIQLLLMTVIVLASFANVKQALAWGGCNGSYYVQWGDTLSQIAYRCGTSVAAIRSANPNLGYWLYAGQTIWLPGSSGGNYYWTPPQPSTQYPQPWQYQQRGNYPQPWQYQQQGYYPQPWYYYQQPWQYGWRGRYGH